MSNSNSLTVSLRQQGNSVGITLPKPFLQALGLAKGNQVDIVLKSGFIEMRPHEDALTIHEMMATYDSKLHNYHDQLPGEIGKELVEGSNLVEENNEGADRKELP